MRTTDRDYSEESGDFRRLCRFMTDNHPHLRTHSTWCLGRLVDWKYGLFESKLAAPAFCERNAHLWFDGFGELAGFAISENGDEEFTILTMEGYRFLYAEMLDWALAHWGDRGPRPSTEITHRQALEARALEGRGFRRDATFYTRSFDLTAELPARYPLEPGFVIVDMATHPDYRAQRILRADAFGGKSDVSEEELRRQLTFYNHSHDGPIYDPRCDLCVMAEDGTLVAGCEALIDARNAVADVERVCTHSGYRRRGFARAVIQECLYRLQDMGLRGAYITGYSPAAIALYGSLGAAGESASYVYRTPAA